GAERAARNRVDAADPARLTPLVGRDREVGLLRERWDVAAEGVGHVVLLVADPGLGKSRLVRVIREYVLQGDQSPSPLTCPVAPPRADLSPGGRGETQRPSYYPRPSGERVAREAQPSTPGEGGTTPGSPNVIEWYCSAYHADSPLYP